MSASPAARSRDTLSANDIDAVTGTRDADGHEVAVKATQLAQAMRVQPPPTDSSIAQMCAGATSPDKEIADGLASQGRVPHP